MRKTVRIRGREVSVKLLAAIFILSLIGAVAAVAYLGKIQIDYEITPGAAEAPTMVPDIASLSLGSIPSGSSGTKDFGKVATLDLPAGYEITFTLDLTTAGDFPTFDVDIAIHVAGETYASYWIYLWETEPWNSGSEILDAGSWDVYVDVTYTAVATTYTRTGSVNIDVSYPG